MKQGETVPIPKKHIQFREASQKVKQAYRSGYKPISNYKFINKDRRMKKANQKTNTLKKMEVNYCKYTTG